MNREKLLARVAAKHCFALCFLGGYILVCSSLEAGVCLFLIIMAIRILSKSIYIRLMLIPLSTNKCVL